MVVQLQILHAFVSRTPDIRTKNTHPVRRLMRRETHVVVRPVRCPSRDILIVSLPTNVTPTPLASRSTTRA